jgi:D-alanyl-D-alanine dipeptidase
MNKIKILSSLELRKIKVTDNKEKLVDLKKECPGIKFKIASYIGKNGGDKAIIDAQYAREEVARKLIKAQSFLPDGYKLIIECAYRSPIVQKKSFDAIYKKLIFEYPHWTEKQIAAEMDNRVSPVDIAPHCGGGAVDLTIIDKLNIPLDMGTELDEFNNKTYTESDLISKKAKENRELLKNSMEKAGFINFPAEWWHWSYGDREWAYYQKNKIAIYGTIGR